MVLYFSLLVLFSDIISGERIALYAQKGWYSANFEALSKQLSFSLDPKSDISAIVAPHAGFKYSLKTAIKAYSKLDAKRYQRVIILGPSHKQNPSKAILSNFGRLKTPIGDLKQDQAGIKALLKHDQYFKIDNQIQQNEHSIELQLPLIKKVLPHVSVIDILIPQLSLTRLQKIAALIKKEMREGDLLIISSDMSHYPGKKVAHRIDQRSFSLLYQGSEYELLKHENRIRKSTLASCSFCGISPMIVA
ncbi:AmmeMemoRadiSam system protein B, partial [bacterium]|nr:AmmeMemoRadiSam system protein B [bacterium]